MTKEEEILKMVKSNNKLVCSNNKMIEKCLDLTQKAHDLQLDFVPLFKSLASMPESLKEFSKSQSTTLMAGMDKQTTALEKGMAGMLQAHKDVLKASTWPWVGKVITLLVVAILALVAALVGFENLSAVKTIL